MNGYALIPFYRFIDDRDTWDNPFPSHLHWLLINRLFCGMISAESDV